MSQGYTRGTSMNTDGTLSGNSDFFTSSERAVRAYTYTTISASTTKIQNGVNIYTGGTPSFPNANLVDSPSFNNLSFSGTATGIPLSATTLSGRTIFIGSTNLYNIFEKINSSLVPHIGNGTNAYTGTTTELNSINVNISALTINTLIVSGNTSFQNVTATTFSATSFTAETLTIADLTGTTSFSIDSNPVVNVGTTLLTGGLSSIFKVVNGGTGCVDFGDYNGSRGAIWFGKSGNTYSTTNFAFTTDVNNETFMSDSTGSRIATNASIWIAISSTQFAVAAGQTKMDFAFSSTNGTRIGVSTTDKIAFWNSVPIIQPTSGTPLNTVLTNIGLMQSGATNVQLNLPVSISGNTTLAKIGNKLIIASGTNASVGVVTLTAGTATVSNTLVTNGSIIMLTPKTLGTITRPVGLGITGRTAGTSFTIVSKSVTDTSIVSWLLIEPL